MRTLSTTAVAAIALACSSDSTGPDLTPIPPPPAHVYVADLNNRLIIYATPLTSASAPVDTIHIGNGPLGVAVDDSGNLAVSVLSKWVYLYQKPISSTSQPVDSVSSLPYYGFPAFGPDGKLYVATQGTRVLVYTPPFTHTSVPDTISDSVHSSISIAFDRQRRLYVDDPPGGGVRVFTPPYAAAPPFKVSGMGATEGMAIDANGRLLAANYTFQKIFIYEPPLSGTSAPVDSIVTAFQQPKGMAIGGDGYLYVAMSGDSAIYVFHPPFSHTSTPAVTLQGHLMVSPWGIAVGK